MRTERIAWLLLVAACGVAALGSCKDEKASDDKSSSDDDSKSKKKRNRGGDASATPKVASGGKFTAADSGGLLSRKSYSAQAKNKVAAISRGAYAAYEREHVGAEALAEGIDVTTHQLCETAVPVPATVPRRQEYQPSPNKGEDFNSGDATTGWKCLGFSVDRPMRYQFRYTKDGSVAKDNPAVCDKNCYEAAAVGDIDGDGVQSVFARTGHLDLATSRIKLATQIYIQNEDE